MDTSKEFINMCEKAVEIQEEWQSLFIDGKSYRKTNRDFVCLKGTTEATFIHNYRNPIPLPLLELYGDIETVYPDLIIWLPRQDQLQNMILENNTPIRLTENFLEFLYGWKNEWKYSREQLWLAFVMKEKYNKIWNGEDWESCADFGE